MKDLMVKQMYQCSRPSFSRSVDSLCENIVFGFCVQLTLNGNSFAGLSHYGFTDRGYSARNTVRAARADGWLINASVRCRCETFLGPRGWVTALTAACFVGRCTGAIFTATNCVQCFLFVFDLCVCSMILFKKNNLWDHEFKPFLW